jgi:hypothetical protein
MTRLVLDAATAGKFEEVHERVEVCDAAGRTLGYFHPANGRNGLTDEDRKGPFTREQLEQFRNEPGGKPLSEILNPLKGK